VASSGEKTVFTVGHSTNAFDDFVRLLEARGVTAVADVRLYPGSRRSPQFSKDTLPRLLDERGIEYLHIRELGGRRKPAADSPNTAWKNDAFRGYADHVATEEFKSGLERLTQLAEQKTTAVMCAEGLWWKCHRRLIADVLHFGRWQVMHILPNGSTEPHVPTEFAVPTAEGLLYPATDPKLLEKPPVPGSPRTHRA
jgi:uncharacterized protein (DUF488 family)